MKLINPQRLSKKQYRELIKSLGGKFGWIDRIKMGGTGVGGLFLFANEQEDLQLRYKNTSESIRFSIEQLKGGILLGFNNTKEIKLAAFQAPIIRWQSLGEQKTPNSRKVTLKIQLEIDEHRLIFYTGGWNNQEVFRYLDRLQEAFTSS